MEKIAQFYKVSLDQFRKDYQKCFPEDSEKAVSEIYQSIIMPKRATKGSAGYDFYAPMNISLLPGREILIPTGIRAKIVNGYVLMLFPRSSLGFRYRLQLNNTVGVIDADYFSAANEGHIMIKLTNDTHENKTAEIKQGTGIAQGIFLPFGITEDDAVVDVRTGGFGSTTH